MSDTGKQFSLNLSKLIERSKASADLVVRKIVFDISARVVMLSPVGDPDHWKSPAPKGYTGGRFRANWQYGEASIPGGELKLVDKGGRATLDRINAAIRAQGAAGRVHYLTNNLPYAMRLETGWSKQAPAGMVGITMREFKGIVARAVKTVRTVKVNL